MKDRENDQWRQKAEDLAPVLRERAPEHDATDTFVQDNYETLKANGFFSAGIPESLGGGGASHSQLCAVLETFGRACGSTALALSMHTHTIAFNVFKHRRGDEKAAGMLSKVAAGELALSTTGANDWLDSSGTLTRTPGGYRLNAHKRFVSGTPGANMLATSARYEDVDGTHVLHFGVPMSAEGLRVVDVWRVKGMRGTGSCDVICEDVFIPEGSIAGRRPAGVWHAVWEAILPIAMPLIMSVYRGIAEEAAALAKAKARPERAADVGALENSLRLVRLAHDDMVRIVDDYAFEPSLHAANATLANKAIVAEHAIDVVSRAARLAGGAAFFRNNPLERLTRDIQASHFHPLPIEKQRVFAGRVALGLEPA